MKQLVKIFGYIMIALVGFYALPAALFVLYTIYADDDSWIFDLDRIEYIGLTGITVLLTIIWIAGLVSLVGA